MPHSLSLESQPKGYSLPVPHSLSLGMSDYYSCKIVITFSTLELIFYFMFSCSFGFGANELTDLISPLNKYDRLYQNT